MSESDRPLVFDDVSIDFAGRRLQRGGMEQPLEPKAFAVLALLAGTPGRAFSRDEILDAVWGHRHVTPGVLNRAMTLLRHALGEDAREPRYLRTVHGVGYRFDLPPGTVPETVAPDIAPAREQAAAPRTATRSGHDTGNEASAFRRAAPWLLPLLAILAILGWKWWPGSHAPVASMAVPVMERSIAVLPLANASGDPDQQFFSDGLSDNLIDALSKFNGLKVIGRTSSFRFRDSDDDSRSIGARLGVAYLISGSVQHVGDAVRIGVQLNATIDGHTVWTEHYDRPYHDLFALQDEIAHAVAAALQAKLLRSPSFAKQDDHPPSGNLDAYNAYLRGMQSFFRQDMRKTVEHMDIATRLDPGYAAAWAQAAVAWALVGYDEPGDEAQVAFRNSRAAVDEALKRAPNLGIAHAALGNLRLGADFDWQGAMDELRRGTELAPGNGPIHGGFSRALAASGRLSEALEERQRALSIEPLQATNHFLYADLLIAAGRLDEAEKTIRIGHGLRPRPALPSLLIYIAILRDDVDTALDIAGRQSSPWREMYLALAAQLETDHAAADIALAKILDDKTWADTSPYLVAQSYALRGDIDKTMEWLERTWARHDTAIHRLLYDPLLLRFRSEPQLIAFCRKIGLPPPSRSEALSMDQIRTSLASGG